ncbi:MAG: hypothetical protein IJ646_01345, partial [Clostridia bacterium]|nr:hypothetical protein [Clostridia bacterium]
TGDPLDEDFRKQIIDVFINSVYLYDDRVIIFYNIRGGKQVSYIDLASASDLPTEPEGSDLKALGVFDRQGTSCKEVSCFFIFQRPSIRSSIVSVTCATTLAFLWMLVTQFTVSHHIPHVPIVHHIGSYHR